MKDHTRTLLIVDDEADIREMLADCAQRDGYLTVHAKNGVEALEILKNQSIEAILTDLVMPEMDGTELILRTRALGLATPFVLVSGMADEDSILRSFRSGACDYIAKPFSSDELRTIISRVLDIGARQKTIENLLDDLADEDEDFREKVEKIKRNSNQIVRLLAMSAR
jgi:DNA-binding NtrC family response regulator